MFIQMLCAGLSTVLFFLAGCASDALAQQPPGVRRAYLVANWQYENLPGLTGPENDLRALAKLLQDEGGFVVRPWSNVATRGDFDKILSTIRDELTSDDTVLFYFAGHGFSIDGDNKLAATSARLSCAPAAARPGTAGHSPIRLSHEQWLSTGELAKELQKAKASILVYDACREKASTAAVLKCPDMRGDESVARAVLGVVGLKFRGETSNDTLYISSVAEGGLAQDVSDATGHSPFMLNFLKQLRDNRSTAMWWSFKRTAEEVARTTLQKPEYREAGNTWATFCLDPANCKAVQPDMLKYTLDEAQAFFAKGDTPNATRILARLAEQGVAVAATRLAEHYEQANNLPAAFELRAKLARDGSRYNRLWVLSKLEKSSRLWRTGVNAVTRARYDAEGAASRLALADDPGYRALMRIKDIEREMLEQHASLAVVLGGTIANAFGREGDPYDFWLASRILSDTTPGSWSPDDQGRALTVVEAAARRGFLPAIYWLATARSAGRSAETASLDRAALTQLIETHVLRADSDRIVARRLDLPHDMIVLGTLRQAQHSLLSTHALVPLLTTAGKVDVEPIKKFVQEHAPRLDWVAVDDDDAPLVRGLRSTMTMLRHQLAGEAEPALLEAAHAVTQPNVFIAGGGDSRDIAARSIVEGVGKTVSTADKARRITAVLIRAEISNTCFESAFPCLAVLKALVESSEPELRTVGIDAIRRLLKELNENFVHNRLDDKTVAAAVARAHYARQLFDWIDTNKVAELPEPQLRAHYRGFDAQSEQYVLNYVMHQANVDRARADSWLKDRNLRIPAPIATEQRFDKIGNTWEPKITRPQGARVYNCNLRHQNSNTFLMPIDNRARTLLVWEQWGPEPLTSSNLRYFPRVGLDDGTPISVEVGGKEFRLFKENRVPPLVEVRSFQNDGPELLALMRTAPFLTFKARSARGVEVVDIYDLHRFGDGVTRLKSLCGFGG
jgi:hypothetical protein